MQITITGPRGSGCTMIANAIYHHLHDDMHQDVSVVGVSRHNERVITSARQTVESFYKRPPITIVDSQERDR